MGAMAVSLAAVAALLAFPATAGPRSNFEGLPKTTYQAREFTLLYAPNEVRARSTQATYILFAIVEHARLSRSPCLHVVGHTDTVGDPLDNRALSLTRAEMLAEDLSLMGVTVPIRVEGRGDTDLARPTADEVDEPLNRRATVLLCLPPPPQPVNAEPVAKAREPERRLPPLSDV